MFYINHCQLSPSLPSNSIRTVRERRYKREEEALHRNLRSISRETSPEELKIRALESATARLSDIAGEAHQRLHQLRQKLSETDLDATNYEALKRQRWIEEQRASLAYNEERSAKERLAGLMRTTSSSSSFAGMSTVINAPNSVTARKQTNLVRFLQDSPTKRPLHPSLSMNDPQRRITSSDITSLKPSSYAWLSRSRVDAPPSSGHTRSKSLIAVQHIDENNDNSDAAKGARPLRLRATQSFQKPTLRVIDEFPSHTEKVTFHLDKSEMISRLGGTSSVSHTLTIPPSAVSIRSISETSSTSVHGHASILPPPPSRSPNDILADLGEVAMPAYAVNLIDSFAGDAVPTIHLSPHLSHRQSDTESASSSSPLRIQKSAYISPRSRNRRSIFSIQLPRKSPSTTAPPPVSRNELPTLTPSLTSTKISEEESYIDSGESARRESLRRAKFLRSTRNWDLSQLDPAPDDVDVDVGWIHLPLPVELPTVVDQSGRDQLQIRNSGFRASLYGSPIVNKIRQRFSLISRN